MPQFKMFVDIVSSLASIVAIVSVLYSWLKSKEDPLTLDRIVIHRNEKYSNYIVGVKNRKPYPVKILATKCYTKRKFHVEQKSNNKLYFSGILSLENLVFEDLSVFEIGANGSEFLKFNEKRKLNDDIEKLLFLFETSHGYHDLSCKDIISVDIGTTNNVGIKYNEMFDSKSKAMIQYYKLKIQHFFKRKES